MVDKLWNTHDIAAYLGYKVSSVNPWLIRHGIKRRRVTRDDHGRTVNLYSAAEVISERKWARPHHDPPHERT
jgi:hypothetical protein